MRSAANGVAAATDHEAKAADAPEAGVAGEEGEEHDEDDDDDLDGGISLAAMEAELKPKVLETFDSIANNYKKLRRLQDQLVERTMQDDGLSLAQQRRYKMLR